MRQELKSKFPEWVNDPLKGKYTTCLSDDIDSLIGCALLRQLKGYDINYFYSFDASYVADKSNRKPVIAVDIALMTRNEKGYMSWDNHVCHVHPNDNPNPISANINVINKINATDKRSYYGKYAGSTFAQMWSYHNLPLPDTEEGKTLFLAIDSLYLGHYSSKFRTTHNNYMHQLELDNLISFLDKHTTKDFEEITQKYHLKDKITVNANTGYLHTTIDIEGVSRALGLDVVLPNKQFALSKRFEVIDLNTDTTSGRNTLRNYVENKRLFSLAVTYPGRVRCSIEKQ